MVVGAGPPRGSAWLVSGDFTPLTLAGKAERSVHLSTFFKGGCAGVAHGWTLAGQPAVVATGMDAANAPESSGTSVMA
jgi:hypothetical protein